MTNSTILQPYFTNIEPVLMNQIKSAKSSIRIIMAWLTSETIINTLINLKAKNPQIEIEIVVDDNKVNEEYFLKYADSLKKAGITIAKQVVKRFLHHKIMVIDNETVVLGSYNYSAKARKNKENIAVIKNKNFASVHSRYFDYLTKEDYIDDNTKLLFKYPGFAQATLCTYYNFTKTEYKKFKSKIVTGACFTHENGIYDEITYSPGFIFNEKVEYMEDLEEQEFPVPIDKEKIKDWVKSRNEGLIFDYYAENRDQRDSINDDLEKNEQAVESFYATKLENTLSTAELEDQIKADIDIILKNHLWQENFELFLTKKIVAELFKSWPKVERPKKGDLKF